MDTPLLRYAGEATVPFYILHQLGVLTVAVMVVQWQAGIGVKIVAISGVAFAVTMLTYELVVRRNRVLEGLFGLKPAAREAISTLTTGIQAGSRLSSSR